MLRLLILQTRNTNVVYVVYTPAVSRAANKYKFNILLVTFNVLLETIQGKTVRISKKIGRHRGGWKQNIKSGIFWSKAIMKYQRQIRGRIETFEHSLDHSVGYFVFILAGEQRIDDFVATCLYKNGMTVGIYRWGFLLSSRKFRKLLLLQR